MKSGQSERGTGAADGWGGGGREGDEEESSGGKPTEKLINVDSFTAACAKSFNVLFSFAFLGICSPLIRLPTDNLGSSCKAH